MKDKYNQPVIKLLLSILINDYKTKRIKIVKSNSNEFDYHLFIAIVYLLTLQAERINEKAKFKTQQQKQIQFVADHIFKQGHQQLLCCEFKAALESFNQTLRIYRHINNQAGEAYSLAGIGNVYQHQRRFGKAIKYLHKSLNIAPDTTDIRQWKAACLGDLGSCYCALGKYADAIIYLQKSFNTGLKIENFEWELQRLSFLIDAYENLKQDEEAIQYLHECINFTKYLRDYKKEEKILNDLCIIYIRLGNLYHNVSNFFKEIECNLESLRFANLIPDNKLQLASLINLGNGYNYLGKYQLAINYHNKSLALARTICDEQGEAKALSNLGDTYEFIGQYDDALSYHKQSLYIEQRRNNLEGKAQSLRSLGIVYCSQGNYHESINKHNQCLAIALEIRNLQLEADSLCNLGINHFILGDYQEAIDKYKQYESIVRKIHDKRGLANVFGNLGSVYQKLNELQLAIDYLHHSIHLAGKIKDRKLEGNFLVGLSIAFLKNGSLEESEKTLHRAINIFEDLILELKKDADQITISDKLAYAYDILIVVLVTQNKTNAALEISDKIRARIFVNSFGKRLAINSLKSIQKLYLDTSIENITIEEIKQIVKEHHYTIVEYSIISDSSLLYIWVINHTGEITFREVNLESLQEDYNSLKQIAMDARQRIDDGLWLSNKDLLQQLYKYLIEKIADLLPTDSNKPVIFIPQYELFLVPFSALQNANGQFLIEQHTILIAPSIMSLKLTVQQRNKIRKRKLDIEENLPNTIVVGNPTMPIDPDSQPPKQLKPLPYAEEEAKEIANLFNTEALIGNKATKVDIVQQMPKAYLIHLATHGLQNDIYLSGIPGAIALTPSDSDNGFLTSSEILDLRLNAELVVLSACNTGIGRITGDGVIGLSRCLLLAGVPSVIVSLWQVEDSSTKFLMTKFYKNLFNNMNKAQALRQAMLATMQQYPNNPKAWAAFTLIGETD